MRLHPILGYGNTKVSLGTSDHDHHTPKQRDLLCSTHILRHCLQDCLGHHRIRRIYLYTQGYQVCIRNYPEEGTQQPIRHQLHGGHRNRQLITVNTVVRRGRKGPRVLVASQQEWQLNKTIK